MEMYSEELEELDRNTVQYMIEEREKRIKEEAELTSKQVPVQNEAYPKGNRNMKNTSFHGICLFCGRIQVQ